MRLLLLPLVSLMACSVSGGSPAPAGKIALICPQPAAPAAARLCSALEAELVQRGYTLAQEADARLILDADNVNAAVLNARLTVERDGSRQIGEQLQLTVMDRATIPNAQIERFAKALLAQTALPQP